jgi:hypothetical protein
LGEVTVPRGASCVRLSLLAQGAVLQGERISVAQVKGRYPDFCFESGKKRKGSIRIGAYLIYKN